MVYVISVLCPLLLTLRRVGKISPVFRLTFAGLCGIIDARSSYEDQRDACASLRAVRPLASLDGCAKMPLQASIFAYGIILSTNRTEVTCLELRLLEYFLAVVREENISRAAEILHVTQPTLSRQMKELEDELHTTLFIRGKRLTLTDSGVMLRRRAEEVVSLMKKIDSEFQQQEEISGIISVGSGGLKAAEILPELIERFRDRYPLVSFELHTGTADHVKEKLEHGLLDFGILLEPVDIEKFDYIRLPAKETWGLLMPADHLLAKEKVITRKQLKDLPLVVTSRTALKSEIEEWLRCPVSELDIVATMNLINNAAPLAERGIACVLTIEGAATMLDPARFAFRPFTPELSMTSVLAWKKLSPYSGASGKFLEYIKSIHSEHTDV